MAKVTISVRAQGDLQELLIDLGSRAGTSVTTRYQTDIYEFFSHVAAFPESCQARPRLGKDIRLGVVSPYSVLYRYDRNADHVLIIRILHGRRRLTRRLLREG